MHTKKQTSSLTVSSTTKPGKYVHTSTYESVMQSRTDVEKWGFSSGWAMPHHSEISGWGRGTGDTESFEKGTGSGSAEQS